MKLLARLLRCNQAASSAEFALVLPLLLVLLFGVIDAGRFMWEYNRAEKATQMGVRYAVVTDTRVQWFHAYSPTPQEGWMRGDPHARQILPVGHPTWPIEVWQLSGPLSLNC